MKTKKSAAALALAFAAALTVYSMTPHGARSVSEALSLCAGKLVPSVFVSVTLSAFLAKSGLWTALAKPLYKPIHAVSGASRAACAVVAIGVLCGFPSAAACAATLYENGAIGKREAEHAAACASLPSPSFFVSFVGVGLMGSAVFGAVLYFTALFSSALVFCATAPESHAERVPAAGKTEFSVARAVPGAVSAGVMNTLVACGSVTLFSVAYDMLRSAFPSDVFRAAVSCALEVTGAAVSSTALPFPAGAVVCAAALGFSGLSAACQVAGALYPAGLSASSYIPIKLCVGAVSAISALMIFCLPFYVFPAFFFVSAIAFFALKLKFFEKAVLIFRAKRDMILTVKKRTEG